MEPSSVISDSDKCPRHEEASSSAAGEKKTTAAYTDARGSTPIESCGSCSIPVFLLRVQADDQTFLLKDGKSRLSKKNFHKSESPKV